MATRKTEQKSEWQLAGQDLWAIAIGRGCQHDMVTTTASNATACELELAVTAAGTGTETVTATLNREPVGVD